MVNIRWPGFGSEHICVTPFVCFRCRPTRSGGLRRGKRVDKLLLRAAEMCVFVLVLSQDDHRDDWSLPGCVPEGGRHGNRHKRYANTSTNKHKHSGAHKATDCVITSGLVRSVCAFRRKCERKRFFHS